MRNFMEEKGNYILLGIVIVLQLITIALIVICVPCATEEKEQKNVVAVEERNVLKNDESDVEVLKVRVDLKGAVKKAGVYEVDSSARISDVIKEAGGLKSNASTKYLNLSKKVSDEMVIYVYTENQIKNMNVNLELQEICECPTVDIKECAGANVIVSTEDKTTDKVAGESNNTESTKISINEASKEELMTLSGIGESKAIAIIEYRNKNNGFKSLEDIMNVSGIGEAAYSKIKDRITL